MGGLKKDVAGMDERPAFNGTVNHTRLQQYRKAYYASISYTDYNTWKSITHTLPICYTNSTDS